VEADPADYEEQAARNRSRSPEQQEAAAAAASLLLGLGMRRSDVLELTGTLGTPPASEGNGSGSDAQAQQQGKAPPPPGGFMPHLGEAARTRQAMATGSPGRQSGSPTKGASSPRADASSSSLSMGVGDEVGVRSSVKQQQDLQLPQQQQQQQQQQLPQPTPSMGLKAQQQPASPWGPRSQKCQFTNLGASQYKSVVGPSWPTVRQAPQQQPQQVPQQAEEAKPDVVVQPPVPHQLVVPSPTAAPVPPLVVPKQVGDVSCGVAGL